MTRRIALIFGMALIGLLFAGALSAQMGKVPAFKVKADNMRFDLGQKTLTWEGHVKFTSPFQEANITCQRLQANAANVKEITSVEARGDVVFSMVVAPKEKGQPSYKLNGQSQLVTYSMQEGSRIVRLVKDKGVRPSLVITDLSTQEKSDLSGTGDVIEYHLDTRHVEVHDATLEHQEAAQ